MPDNKAILSVRFGDGTTEQWTPDQYEQVKDKLYQADPKAKVVRSGVYNPEEGINNNDAFDIQFSDGATERWNGEQLGQVYDKLMQADPKAQIIRHSDLTTQYWKPKEDEAKARLDEFDALNGEFINDFDARTAKASSTMSGTLSPEYKAFVDANGAKYDDLIRQREELRRDYFSNPLVMERYENNALGAADRRDEYEERARNAADRAERKDWQRAAKLEDDIRKMYEAPNKYNEEIDGGNGFAKYLQDYKQGAFDKFSDKDYYTFGLSNIARNFDLRGIAEKVQNAGSEADIDQILTDSEKAQLNAFYNLAEAQMERADNIAGAYTAGQTAAESTKFMAEFLLSQGAANLLGKGMAASSNALTSWLGRQLMSNQALASAAAEKTAQGARIAAGMAREAGKAAPVRFASQVVSKPVIQGLWHTGTQLSTLEAISDNMMKTDSERELISRGQAIGTAVMDQIIENWSESLGGAVEGRLAPKFEGKTQFGRFARWLNESAPAKVLGEAGFNGLLGEIGEEWAGNAVRLGTGLMSKEEFKDFASWEQQLEMAASFAPMSLIGIGTASAAAIRNARDYKDLSGKVADIMKRQGREGEIENLLHTDFDTPEDIGKKLAPILSEISKKAQEEGATDEIKADYKTMLDFAKILGEQAVIDEQQRLEQEGKRNQVRDDIQGRVGRFWEEGDESVPEDQRHVRVVTDDEGNRIYVTASDEKGVTGVSVEDGKRKIIDAEKIQEDTTLPMAEYLQQQSDLRDQDTERQRMEQETAEQLNAVMQRVQPNTVIPMGTESEPVNATVMATDKEGAVLHWQTADGKVKEEKKPWSEIASLIGSPITVKTDAELEQETAEAMEKANERAKTFNKVPAGTTMVVNLEEVGPVNLKFQKAVVDDGQVLVYGIDEEGNSQPYAESDIANLEEMLAAPVEEKVESNPYVAGEQITYMDEAGNTHKGKVAEADNGGGYTTVELENGATATVRTDRLAIDNEVPRDSRGKAMPTRINKETGQTEVDSDLLWKENPQAWVEWNDSNPDSTVSSDKKLSFNINALNGRINDNAARMEDMELRGGHQDEVDAIREEQKTLIERRDQLQTLLNGRVAAVANAAAAESEAAPVQETQPAAQQAPVAYEQGTPQATYADIYGNEAFETAEEADGFVQGRIATATAEVQKAQKAYDKVQADNKAGKYASPAEFAQAKAQAQQDLAAAQSNLDHWNGVKAIADNAVAEVEAERQRIAEELQAERQRVEAKAAAMRQYMDTIQSEGYEATVVTRDNILDTMRQDGCREEDIELVRQELQRSKERGYALRGIRVNGNIYMLADDIKDEESARTTYIHERQHGITRKRGYARIVQMMNIPYREMEQIVEHLCGTTAYNGSSAGALAEEMLSMAMEVAYSVPQEEVENALKAKGVTNQKFINFVKTIDDEQRTDRHLRNARRDTLRPVNAERGGRQDGRDRQPLPDRDMEREGSRPGRDGEQGAGGEQGAVLSRTGQEPGAIADNAFHKEGDELTSYIDNPTGQKDASAPAEVLFSLTREGDLRTQADNFLAQLESKPMTAEELSVGNDAIGEMVDYMLPYLDKVKEGKRYLPEEIFGKGWTTIFKNGSYGRTMENTLICMRTLAYNDFVNAVQEKIGRPLTPTESFLASQMLYDIATDPQCLYCYVALDRKAYNGFLKTYIEQRDAVLDKYKADDSIDKTYRLPEQAKSRKARKKLPADNQVNALYLEYLDGRADTPAMRNRFNGWLDRVADGTLIGMKDLTSPETMQKVAGKGAEYASQIDDAHRYAQSASWAKKQEEYRAYNGELLSMPQNVVDLLNSEYGLRFYSFSEYSPAFIVENMQMVRDAALRNLVGLAYTKEIDFAKIFAPTGININISVYGREAEDGTVVMDTKQGADWNEAQALREKYGNVGCVFVATNDRMVEWALQQPWIDVVIPFHIVRTGEDIAKFYNWTNYTSMEADKDAKGRSKDIMPTEHMNDKETFLRLCEERGLKPRFADLILPSTGKSVVEDPNYMKLVNETRRSVNETTRIKPTFDVEEARKSFDAFVEKGGYYAGWYNEEGAFERGVEQVAADVEAGKTAMDVDYGRQDIRTSAAKLAELATKRTRPRKHQGTPRRVGEDVQFSKTVVTPEQDAEYLAAVKSGDMDKAQRMVDDAAKAAGYNSPKLYHGTDAFGFTVVDNDKLDDKYSFFATDKEDVAGTYTSYNKKRGISTEIGDEEIEQLQQELEDRLDDEIRSFRRLIDRTFSEWFFGQGDNSVIRDAVMNANPMTGYGDGVYDVLLDFVGDAYDAYRDDVKDADKYEDFAEWQENSPEYEKIEEAMIALEGTRRQLYDIWNTQGGIYELYAKLDNMFEVDVKGELWNNIQPESLPGIGKPLSKPPIRYKTRDIAMLAERYGYSGVIFKNIRDNGKYGRTEASTVYDFFNAQSQVKSADPVTYDNDGNVIPLSQRFNPENEDIRFSRTAEPQAVDNVMAYINGTTPEEEMEIRITEDLFRRAKERFGTTEDIREAGYVLPDGSMLDFSGRYWMEPGSDTSFLAGYRQVDHRDIADLAYERDGNTPTGVETSMTDFIQRGAIRINDSGNWGSINLTVKPTAEQRSRLRRLVDHNNGNITVDFGDGSHTDHSVEYSGARIDRVLNEIDRYFDEGYKPEGTLRFSLRGERGAQTAQDAQALANLVVAEQMEEQGKDAKTIWLSTGWERGKDGEWRNEIPDGEAKAIENTKKATVKDVIDAPELFVSYPQLGDIKIKFNKSRTYTGSYDRNTNTIGMHTDNLATSADGKPYLSEEGMSTMMHELQHVIQSIEGFARGGNPAQERTEYLKEMAVDLPELVTFSEIFSRTNPQQTLIRAGRQKVADLARKNATGYTKEIDMNALADRLDAIDDQDYAKMVREGARLQKLAWQHGESRYERLAGEVESRNVQKRMGMSDASKSQTPPSETEDIRREDQGVRFSRAQEANKVPGQQYPTNADLMEDELRFSLSKNNRKTIEAWMNKRQDLSEDERKAVVDYIDGLPDAKTQLATGKWFAQGAIRLPEDMDKVEQAVSVAGKAKVDPLQYDSPMALLDAHADFKPTEKRVNPDDVPTLHRAKEYPEYGVVVYDVDESDESRQNMREIINTHFGKEASPWCLLQGNGNGKLTRDSAHYWEHYNAYPKQVAFKDGKLLAFSANDKKQPAWWDRQDKSHAGIPIVIKIEGDQLGRRADHELGEDGKIERIGRPYKGSKENGLYQEWYDDDRPYFEASYKDGLLEGPGRMWFPNGQLQYDAVYKKGSVVGEQKWWHMNGNLKSIRHFSEDHDEEGHQQFWYEDGTPNKEYTLVGGEPYNRHYDGVYQVWYKNGQLKERKYYKWGSQDGVFEEWSEDGVPLFRGEYKRNKAEGLHKRWWLNGNIQSRRNYKNDEQDGVQEFFDDRGKLQEHVEYEKGRLDGRREIYFDNGHIRKLEHYKDGRKDGIFIEWEEDGRPVFAGEYKDGQYTKRNWFYDSVGNLSYIADYLNLDDGHVVRFYNKDGNLESAFYYPIEQGSRNLLTEGMTEDDILNFIEEHGGAPKDEPNPFDQELSFSRSADLTDAQKKVLAFINGEDEQPRFSRVTPEQDAEYLEAVKAGDMDKARKAEREAAKAAGYPITAYHGTWEGPFNIFKANEWLKEENGDTKIKGWFSLDKDFSEDYGPAKPYHLKIQNPIEIPFYEKTLDEWKQWFADKGVADVKFDSSIEEESLNGADYGDGVRKYYPVELFDSPRGFNGDGNITEAIEKAGYDGIYYPQEKAYAPFRETQIKSADPVTYDEDGNVIPLSQRFNPENEDIRFSIAYHGSAADFEKFDTKFIRTGEGSQAYGVGIYVTDVESTGRMYASIAALNNEKRSRELSELYNRISRAEDWLKSYREWSKEMREMLDYDKTTDEQKEKIRASLAKEEEEIADREKKLQELYAKREEVENRQHKLADFTQDLDNPEESTRHLYTVEIPDDNGENYLEWNKDLTDSQLEKIISAAQKHKGEKWDAVVESMQSRLDDKDRDRNGETIVELIGYDLEGTGHNSKMASNLLRRAGFVGMKVETGHKRGGDGRGMNFVIYNPKDIQIEDHIRFSRANDNQRIFVSNAEAAVDAIPMAKATPQQWLKMIESKGGLKAGEDKWIGLSDWLREQDKPSKENAIDNSVSLKNIIGKTIVGYRYGAAPESGRSYNTATNEYEAGVSMASVGYLGETQSFVVDAYDGKNKHYYVGQIADETGGDDEILLTDVKEISQEEYEQALPKYKTTSNDVANALYNRTVSLASQGYGVNVERAQDKRDAALQPATKKTLTKQDVQDYIAQHQIQIEETRYADGEGLYREPLEALYDEFDQLASEETATRAFDRMAEKYGDDFKQGFEINGDSLAPVFVEKYTMDGGEDFSPATYRFLNEWTGSQAKAINDTRLNYTTDGLDNKREIALTVPTIEPWNESDQIHFGDAGEGRAVAWVRFGETMTEKGEGDAPIEVKYIGAEPADDAHRQAIDGILLNWNDHESVMRNEDREDQFWSARSMYENAIRDNMYSYNEEEGQRAEQILAALDDIKQEDFDAVYERGKRVLFIDEIQSKRHQDAREQGYQVPIGGERVGEYNTVGGETTAPIYNRDGGIIGKMHQQPDGWWTESSDGRYLSSTRSTEADALSALVRWYEPKGIPAAPFEKNWHELAMKRMLRLAAEEGYDYVAWTTGDQQAERYDIGNILDYIVREENDEEDNRVFELGIVAGGNTIKLKTDEEGKIVWSNEIEFNDKNLSEVVGKDMAAKMLALEEGDDLDGDRLRVGAEGMKGFYDQMLPRFMDKYGKKWGVKTEDMELPNLANGITAHAIPVTEEMKESVMEGQLMFSRAAQAVEQADEGGIQAVVGSDNAKEFAADIYRAMPAEMRRTAVDKAMGGDLNIHKALVDDLSRIAYEGYENDEAGILRAAGKILSYYAGENLDEATVRYILWRNGQPNDLLTDAQATALKKRWGVGEDLRFSRDEMKESVDAADNAAEATVDEAAKALSDGKRDLKDMLTATRAMRLQKEYDKKTIEAVTNLAKRLLKDQYVSEMSRRDIARLLGLVRTSAGRSPRIVKRNADTIVEIVIDNLLKKEKAKFENVIKKSGTKTNATGVEVQGELDIQGQKTLKAFRDGIKIDIGRPDDNETANTLYGMRARIQEDLDSKDDAVRAEAEAIDIGLQLAIEYKEGINELEAEKELLEEQKEKSERLVNEGSMTKQAKEEALESIGDAIRENKIERIQAYRDFMVKMNAILSQSHEDRAAFVQEEKDRVNEIHHLANSDMQGKSASRDKRPTFADKLANNPIARFAMAPLATFDQMLRLFGEKSINGEGYLWNRFMSKWQKATENEYIGQRDAKEKLDKKVSEVFGKKMIWSDLYDVERKMPKVTARWWDDGEMKDHELTQGQLLYIYMVNKMADGRMKLRRMGIEQEHVDAIARQMDERFLTLADWLQEEFLVDLRNKYNAVHERLFGASMAAIDDYFPLVINKRDLERNEDVGLDTDFDSLPSTTTGSIIKRKRNNKALDLMNADAFSVVIDHIDQMEKWAAFAEFNKDVNALLSYKRFRNQVQNMASVYGSGTKLWDNFKSVAKIAAGSYKPKRSNLDKDLVNIAKGVTAAKISFRVYTALKQTLSSPAFLADASMPNLAKSLATAGKSWSWAMENLPIFEKRWKSRIAGDTRLMQTDLDWNFYRQKLYDKASKLGMSPNAFVDAVTVAVGAKAIYDTKYAQFKSEGFSDEDADRKAKTAATVLVNETQQSSEGAFVSPVQLDRTVLATMITVFRNSSMGFQRQVHDSLRNLGKHLKPGYKEQSMEYTKKQLMRDGLTEEQAEQAAKKRYNKSFVRDATRLAVFGFLVEFSWNLGSYIVYLLFGDDDDKKKEMLADAARHAMFGGLIEGLAGGNVMSEGLNTVAQGESLWNYDPQLLPLFADIKSAYSKMSSDPVAGWNDVVNLAVQAGIGVNPQTLTDAVVAVADACDGDLETSKEAMLLIMRVLQVPQSQVDELYIDELGTTARGAQKMSYSQMAQRYADYKIAREAPLTGWAYSDEARKKREKSKKTTFKKKVNERKK